MQGRTRFIAICSLYLIHDSKNKTVHIHAETYITEMLRHVERGADGD